MAPSTEGPMRDRILYRLTWLARAVAWRTAGPGPGHHSATDTPSRSVESVTAPW